MHWPAADIYCSDNHALIVWLQESSSSGGGGTDDFNGILSNIHFSQRFSFFLVPFVHSMELIPFQLENKNEFRSKFLQPNLQCYHSLVNPSSQQNEKKNANKRRTKW